MIPLVLSLSGVCGRIARGSQAPWKGMTFMQTCPSAVPSWPAPRFPCRLCGESSPAPGAACVTVASTRHVLSPLVAFLSEKLIVYLLI